MIDEQKLKKFIGEKVKEYRKERKWSQKELGNRIGVSHNTVSDYENGKISIGQDMLFVLADVFEITIDDFFPARKVLNVSDLIDNENFDTSDIEFLRYLIEKTESFNGSDRDKFMQNIRFAVEFFEKSNK